MSVFRTAGTSAVSWHSVVMACEHEPRGCLGVLYHHRTLQFHQTVFSRLVAEDI